MEFRALSNLFITIVMSASMALAAEEKPQPDAQFGNWLYKTPDAKVWRATEKDGALVFAIDLPPGDFCTITLSRGAKAEADFARQFENAVSADLKAKGSLRIEADGGNEPRKSDEGFDVLTRRIQAETAQFHT